jgi:hypothetical protein
MSGATANNLNLSIPGFLRTLSLCAAAVGLLAPTVRAVEFAGGTGAPAAPYQIATAEQLVAIGDDPNLLDKYFVLVSDIDLDPNLPGGRVFTQAVIAYENDVFRTSRISYTGRFYGEGHTIRNLTIAGTGLQYFGLFGTIGSAGRVYDVVLQDVCITSAERAGGLAGLNRGGLVNCSVTGRICGPERSGWLGGLAGVNDGTIIGCHSAVTVTGGDYSLMLGGLVGMHRGGIDTCSATGDVGGGDGSFHLGGLVGASVGGVIRDSLAAGDILGSDASWGLGALAGRADSDAVLANCRASGSVMAGAAAHDLGGLVGACYGADITHCHATGGVSGRDASYHLGGLLGLCLATTLSDCYAVGDVCGFRSLGGFVGRVQTGTSIANCHAVGKVLRNGRPWGRGGFAGSVEGPSDVSIVGCFWDIEASGAGSSAAGVGLTTAQMQDASIFRTTGWDMAGDGSDGTADLWLVPEGGRYPVLAALWQSYEPHMLEGSGASFDPYLIASAEDLGAVGRHRRSAWYRLVDDIDLSGVTWATAPVAALSGVFDGHGHRIRNLTIRGEKTSGLGLFGRIETGAWVYNLGLENVAIAVPDGSRHAGGLAGENAGYVVDCFVTGTVSAGSDCRSVGGLVGVNRLGVISDCYTVVDVEVADGAAQIGGLAGYNYMGTLNNGYAGGGVRGWEDNESCGALVGHGSEHARTYGCYYLAASDGGGPDQGAGHAAKAEQLRQAITFVDWDFKTTWMICEGQDYPHLRWEGLTCGP